jgi:hypothetical protein
MRNASGPETNHVVSDFSYRCRPIAGEGYFLVGDAGAFLDPIFSTGVTLAMEGAVQVTNQLADIFSGKTSPAAARKKYIRFIEGSTAVFWRLVRGYYKHSFRELFMHGVGPLDVHRAVVAILAGHVFPKPEWKLRWRLRFFELCIFVNQYIAIVPRKNRFSLMSEPPNDFACPPIEAAQATMA